VTDADPAGPSRTGRALLLLVVVALLPSIAAAFGVWSPLGALQQAWVLDTLLSLTLKLEEGHFATGVLGTWEIPTALGALALLTASAALWQPRLPAVLGWVVAVPEGALACLGLLGAAGLVAVGVAVDRSLFLFGLAAAGVSAVGMSAPEAPWADRRNLVWRLAVVVGSAAAIVYGAASLLEGATWTNPVFRLSAWWVDGLGRSPWTSGGAWCLVLLLALPALAWRRSPRLLVALALAGMGALVSAITAEAPHLAVARGVSGLGIAVAAVLLAPVLVPPHAPGLLTLDPRRLARTGVPLLLWAGLCAVRGLSVSMWTVPAELPPGVERIAEQDCAFSIRAADSGIWFTDRCRNALGHVDAAGALNTWDLSEYGGTQVEELGGPEGGTLFAAIAAWTDEAQLVLLAVDEQDGPRRVDEGFSEGADAPYIPLPSCWASAWIPLPDGGVLLGCENTSQAHVLDPSDRSMPARVELGSRLEEGSFDAERQHLYGVALWDDATVRAWRWPSGEVAAEATIGPFNWSALHVPDDDAVWVSRFLEGSILRLDPSDLSRRGRAGVSFGVRALHHDPVHRLVWASASYTGLLWALPTDGGEARSLALCGQGRDLASDASGRLIVGTDCGLFRVDPAVAFAP
jgi:hypothetical protein